MAATDGRGLRVLAVVPAFREGSTVGAVVAALRAQGLPVLVVDDCSPDDTSAAAAAAGAEVVRLPVNLGYGGALQTGYRFAVAHGYDAVVQLDGDGQHDPAFAEAVLAPVRAGAADVVKGSRFLGVPGYEVPLARRLGQRLFGALAGLLTGRSLTDPTSGFQALTREVLQAYCSPLFPEDFPDADVLVMLHRMGFRVAEVPVRMTAGTGRSMHGGLLGPLYYVYKMTLAVFVACFRPLPKRRSG